MTALADFWNSDGGRRKHVPSENFKHRKKTAPKKYIKQGWPLTDLQKKIMALLEKGLTNQEVAERIGCSVPCVAYNRKRHYRPIIAQMDAELSDLLDMTENGRIKEL